jgi:hypothetical protein
MNDYDVKFRNLVAKFLGFLPKYEDVAEVFYYAVLKQEAIIKREGDEKSRRTERYLAQLVAEQIFQRECEKRWGV